MKINLDDKVILSAALDKASDGEYFDALCLFARVNSYESMLNQLGCLCALRDVGYAHELYRNLLSKYYFTHNCKSDVCKLGDATELLSSDFGRNATIQPDPSKICADENMLAFYPMGLDDFVDEDDFDSLAEALEYTVQETQKSVFYDVKSPEFYLNLCQRMERAYFEGNLSKGRELQRQFMDIETDDAGTVEMQLFLCLTQQQWERGVPYALRYATFPDATARGMGACAQILSRAGDEHKEVLEQLLTKLSDYGEEISDVAMMDYVQIAASSLGYGEVTLKLTNILYGHYKDAGCSALCLCARTFFNCGEYGLARDAILKLIRAVPWDGVAAVYLTYINKRLPVALDGIATSNSLARHFDIPTQLSVIAQYALLKDMEQNNLVLDSSSYPLIKCMFKLCLGCILKGDVDKFFSEAQTLDAILNNFIPKDNNEFFDCAKQCLAGIISEPSLNKGFVRKLIELGYRDRLFVSTSSGYYALNLSRLTVTDQAFVSAFGICATLRKVEVRKLENAYRQLKKTLNCDVDNDDDMLRQLAYAMLALSYKRFGQSSESTYFSDDEHALYMKFLQQTKQ